MTHEPRTADQAITEIVGRLSTRFPSYPTLTIREIVSHAYEQFNDALVRDFVEVLVEKQAKQQLKILDLETAAAIEW
jgi:hypothetical protein